MITRLWRGWTAIENADDYESFLLTELFPSMRDIEGFLGANVLRRSSGDDGVAFVTLVRFSAITDVQRFAGDNLDVPVIEPRAAELLSYFDERAEHFETSEFTN